MTFGPESSKCRLAHFLVRTLDEMKYIRERLRSAMKHVPGVTAFLLMIPFFFFPRTELRSADNVTFCARTGRSC